MKIKKMRKMKHNFKFYAAMACSAITLASCSSEAIEDAKTAGKKQMTFTAQQETNVSSRTSLGNDLSVLWADNDAISIFDTENHDFSITNGAGSSTAEFSGTAGTADTYYAVYPYQSGATISGNVISNVVIPAEQKATANTFDPKANIMTAVSNSANNLAFKNVCSYAKITTTADCKKITFTAGAEDKIAGTFNMTVGADGIATATATSGVNAITLVPSTDDTFAYGTYYIAINAGNMSALKVECEYADKTVYQSINAAISVFTRGSIIDLGSTEGWPEAAPSINGHEYVVIGGKKWATMNVGATTVADDPATYYGDYFGWGDTEPRYTGLIISLTTITATGYKSEYPRGYDAPSYTGETLDAAHDAATVNWGSTWRTPTPEDYQTLYEACGGTGLGMSNIPPYKLSGTPKKGIFQCREKNGISGLLFCDGTNKLFFPATGGMRLTYGVGDATIDGSYWTSSVAYNGGLYMDFAINWDPSSVTPYFDHYNNYGYPVRPVSD